MGYEDVITNGFLRCEYDSLAEFAAAAQRRTTGALGCTGDSKHDSGWYLGASFADAVRMASEGWQDELEATLEIAESAVEMADKEHMTDSFNQPVWDVTGAMVDVGAYLAGTPECMIDYPLTETSKVGRVITLVASISVSGSVSADTIARRGRLIVALALALARLGHATELWISNHNSISAPGAETRIKVKGVNDEIDPSVIMFAYAHPAVQRRLMFAVAEGYPGKWRRRTKMGRPMPPTTDGLPEGTIVLPEICSDRDIPQADEFLRRYLGELGLLAE